MAIDDLPIEPEPIPPEEPEVPEEIPMETRAVFNHSGVEVGELTLPAATSEEEWTIKLEEYSDPVVKPLNQVIEDNMLMPAKRFAAQIIRDFTVENILMGITAAGKTEMIANAVKDVVYHCNTGSLYVAESEAGEIEILEGMAPFITEARVTAFRNKLRLYLLMPLLQIE